MSTRVSTPRYGATPPWELAPSTYDPVAFADYFKWRPAAVLWRACEVAVRLGDVGARVYVKRGTIEDRARRLREHFTALGPAFVKLGQVLSTRADLLPASYCAELTKLQDDLPPASAEHAAALLRREMGFAPEAVFEHLPTEPVAAASLAQVYRARIKGGLEVAVKLQRPGLGRSVALDATILRAAAFAVRSVVRLRSDVVGIVDELIGRIFDEMDYRREADSIERFYETYRAGGGAGAGLEGLVRAPVVLRELSSAAVLTMEWVDGTRLTDLPAMRSLGLEPDALLERGVRCSLHQLLETGFMHSDPHPGNLVVGRDGALVYLDFGMTVDVPAHARRAMIRGLVGFVNRDAASMVRDLVALDFLPQRTDVSAATAALRDVFDRAEANAGGGEDGVAGGGGGVLPTGSAIRGTNDFLGVVSQLSAALLQHDFRLPPYFARILRALAALEGTATGIDRDFKVIERAYPYVLTQVLTDRSPEMREILRRLVLEDGGTSVRWLRVRRLVSAYTAAGGDGGGGGGGGFDFFHDGSPREAAAAAANTLGALAEGAHQVLLETAAGVSAAAAGNRTGAAPGSAARPSPGGESVGQGAGGASVDARDGFLGDDPTQGAAAVAEAVRDAMNYVMSPDGAPLRATLVRDVLDAGDAYLAALAAEESADRDRRARRRAQRRRGEGPIGGDEREEREEDRTTSDGSASRRPDLGFDDLAALVETGRKMYLRAPRTWAPVIAAAARRPEACEMIAAVARGAGERVTCDNVKLVARGVVRSVL